MFDGYRVEVTLKTTQHIVRGTNLMQATVCVSADVFSKKKQIKHLFDRGDTGRTWP